LTARGFSVDAYDEPVVEPLAARISSDSLKRGLILNSWRTVQKGTRTQLLAEKLDDWFSGGLQLNHVEVLHPAAPGSPVPRPVGMHVVQRCSLGEDYGDPADSGHGARRVEAPVRSATTPQDGREGKSRGTGSR
jgi:hypothetical protein